MLGCVGRGRRDVGRGTRGRCRKVRWDVGKVRGDVGKGEEGDVGKCVAYTLPHPSPLTPYTLPHFSTPHTSFLISPHTPRHFPTPPPKAPLISPYTPTHFPTHPMHSPHIFPHSFDYRYVAKLPCDDVTLINLIGKAR